MWREGLQGSRQFWYRRGMIFFTFSAADFHCQDLHELMLHRDSLSTLSEQDANKIQATHITAWILRSASKGSWKRCDREISCVFGRVLRLTTMVFSMERLLPN
jgi:hypothetical protein